MIPGELVNLRAVERTDAPLIHRWFNDPDLMRYWGISDATLSFDAVQRRIEDWLSDEALHDRPSALIIDDLEGQSVGLIVLSDFQTPAHSVALSLLIGERDRWGQGLGGDALRTIVETCFSAWNLHRLWLHVEAFNERAQRLYRKHGFRHEGTLRAASYFDGAYQDVLVFGLLASDLTSEEPIP